MVILALAFLFFAPGCSDKSGDGDADTSGDTIESDDGAGADTGDDGELVEEDLPLDEDPDAADAIEDEIPDDPLDMEIDEDSDTADGTGVEELEDIVEIADLIDADADDIDEEEEEPLSKDFTRTDYNPDSITYEQERTLSEMVGKVIVLSFYSYT